MNRRIEIFIFDSCPDNPAWKKLDEFLQDHPEVEKTDIVSVDYQVNMKETGFKGKESAHSIFLTVLLSETFHSKLFKLSRSVERIMPNAMQVPPFDATAATNAIIKMSKGLPVDTLKGLHDFFARRVDESEK